MQFRPWRRILFVVWLIAICCPTALRGAQPSKSVGDGFVSLFDGKTLTGWGAVPKATASDWTVRDGAIVGYGGTGKLSYLVWKDKDLADFELKLRYRLRGKGNTGVEIRARRDPSGKRVFESYHADIGHVGIGMFVLGAWDFHFATRREYPCRRGMRLLLDENDKAHPSRIAGALTGADVRQGQWNDVRIVARGRRCRFFINSRLSSEFTDNVKRGNLERGAIGLQIHDKGMRVEFKDIRLKRLIDTGPPLPTIDISGETDRQIVVAAGTKDLYQGHPHTLLLPDGKTMFCVWTENHGPGVPFMKRSDDAGRTWSKLLPYPKNWMRLGNCPTINRIVAPDGTARLLLMDSCDPKTGSGPFGQSISEDGGKTWSRMKYNGLRGITAPISYVPVERGRKHIMLTHRGRGDRDSSPLAVWQAESPDGGLTWKNFRKVCEAPGKDPCEAAVVRSPDGKQLLMLLRDNTHNGNSLMIVSNDEGKTWSKPVETPWGLTGDRHCPKYAPDGRLVVVFRDVAQPCPPRGHFVAWVGRYEDIIKGREGQYRIKLMHHHGRAGDTGYAGLDLLPDGTFVATTYIKYKPGPEKHSVVSVRFKLEETDRKFKAMAPGAAATRAERAVSIGLRKQLLVDDYIIAEKHNVTRELGKVRKVGVVMKPSLPTDFIPPLGQRGDRYYERALKSGKKPDGSPVALDFGFFTTVLWNERDEKFQMWYMPWRMAGVGYAESKDGINWTKPLVGKDSKTNIVHPSQSFSCTIDPTLPWGHPEKYKAAFDSNTDRVCQTCLAYSADGIHWKDYNDGKPVTHRAADFFCQILWDPIMRKYRLMCRTDIGGQGGKKEYRSARIMVHDKGNNLKKHPTAWKTIADRIVVDDPKKEKNPWGNPRLQFNWLTTWIYEGVYFAPMNVYTMDQSQMFEGFDYKTRHEKDVIDIYFGTSRDGVNFDKSWVHARKPLVPRGPAGSFDKDCVFPASQFLTHKDEHWIYYGAANERHFSIGRDMKIGLAKLRLDGFVCLAAGDTPGAIVTRPFKLEGERLLVNVDASRGSLRVEVLDAGGEPVPGFSAGDSKVYEKVDDLRFSPQWKSGADLSALKGKSIRLKFHLRNAKLYSFRAAPLAKKHARYLLLNSRIIEKFELKQSKLYSFSFR